MSSKYLFRALQYRADSPVKKLLLIKLGDVSDDNGQSFYSYQSLGDICCLGRSTVKKHLKELEGQGLLKIENRVGPNGNSSNFYTLNIPATDWEKDKDPVAVNNTGVAGDNTGGVAGDSPESKNSFKSKKQTSGDAHSELVLRAFDFFWNTWRECKKSLDVPNTSPKPKALEKFKKMFNATYFKSHTEDEFKAEINAMCETAKAGHALQSPDGFNPFKNMQTGKFLTNQQWR